MTKSDRSTGLSEGEFMRLFVRHERILRAYARSLLPDWDMVDDVLQDASVTMWEKLSQLRDETGFLPWARVIVRFKCLSAVSSGRRNRLILSDESLRLLADEAEALTTEEADELRHALEACLAGFSEAHQELLLAPYNGDGKVKQLADRCGKSANALYKLLGRLRDKLSDCIHGRLQPGVS